MSIKKYSISKKDNKQYYNFGYDKSSDTYEQKQRINLSENAWIVIDDDREIFFGENEKNSFSGFLNKIFTNFYQIADASINQRLMEKEDYLHNIYSSKEFDNFDKQSLNAFILKQCELYEESLIKKAFNYPKNESRSFNINRTNMDILSESLEADYYEGSRGDYLKSLFEEYATLPQYVREKIVFQNDVINKIDSAISKEKKLKITLLGRRSVNNEFTVNPKFYVTPYKIIQDKTNTFNYLIGFSERILETKSDGNLAVAPKQTAILPKQLSCFRISRIAKIDVMSSMGAHISKDNAKFIEEKIMERDIQFLTSDIIDIDVQFNDKGIEAFKRQLYMRPRTYTIDSKNKYHYTFQCTEVQAINYFFKFGKNVNILSPDFLRDKFIERYKSALDSYDNK